MMALQKNRNGGIKAVGEVPRRIQIISTILWRRTALDGKLCVFDDLEEYINIRNLLQPATVHFFLQQNDRADPTNHREF